MITQCLCISYNKEREIFDCIDPLSPHDALKHHFTFLKTYLNLLQERVLERKFPYATGLPTHDNFL